MKFEVTENKKNDLLGRKEISGMLSFEGAVPKRGDVLKAIAAATKSKEGMTVVKKIDSHYGSQTANVTAFAYSDKAIFEKVEREYMRTRNIIKEEPKEEVAEAPATEAPAEAPKEETPEPAKEEAKKEDA